MNFDESTRFVLRRWHTHQLFKCSLYLCLRARFNQNEYNKIRLWDVRWFQHALKNDGNEMEKNDDFILFIRCVTDTTEAKYSQYICFFSGRSRRCRFFRHLIWRVENGEIEVCRCHDDAIKQRRVDRNHSRPMKNLFSRRNVAWILAFATKEK